MNRPPPRRQGRHFPFFLLLLLLLFLLLFLFLFLFLLLGFSGFQNNPWVFEITFGLFRVSFFGKALLPYKNPAHISRAGRKSGYLVVTFVVPDQEVREVQPSNAQLSILLTLPGMLTLVRLLQP